MVTPTPAPAPPRPRGGAAKPIRTGRFIRDYLRRYGEAFIADIHGALKSEIGIYNMRRPRREWLRSPTYESFVKYFGHVRRLGLVEFVRDEPLVWGHPQMVSIRPPDEVVASTRRVYRLSDLGADPASDIFWDDPLFRSLFRAVMVGPPAPAG